MSTFNNGNINAVIQQYTTQKQSCEAELNKINTELAISDNNLQQFLAAAQEQFGTQDINMLNTILTNLTTEYDTLTNELNGLNANTAANAAPTGAVGSF